MTITKVTFEQFLLAAPTDKAYNLIEQYNAVTSYEDNAFAKEADTLYSRKAVNVLPLSNDNLKQQLIDQVEAESITIKGRDLAELTSLAEHFSKENFGNPDTLLDLGDNKYILLENAAESIRIKLLDPTQGCIICYAPNRFVIIEHKV